MLTTLAALGAGIWLILHLQALASVFSGRADVVPSPKRPRASRRAVWIAFGVFNAGWIASFAIYFIAMNGAAGTAPIW